MKVTNKPENKSMAKLIAAAALVVSCGANTGCVKGLDKLVSITNNVEHIAYNIERTMESASDTISEVVAIPGRINQSQTYNEQTRADLYNANTEKEAARVSNEIQTDALYNYRDPVKEHQVKMVRMDQQYLDIMNGRY